MYLHTVQGVSFDVPILRRFRSALLKELLKELRRQLVNRFRFRVQYFGVGNRSRGLKIGSSDLRRVTRRSANLESTNSGADPNSGVSCLH
jgi:hypothetical protein